VKVHTAHFVFGLSLSLATMSSAQESAPVDSIVLKRKHDLCGGCTPFADIILRRRNVPSWMLDTIDARARSAGVYQLPADILGKVTWCRVAVSDNVMASLSIYHANSVASVRGYRHCLGADSKAISDRAVPIEKQRLLEVEALIDSVAIRTGRFATRQPNER